MVYIRPSVPVVAVAPIRPVGDATQADEEQSPERRVVVNEYLARPQVERRKQRDDRRQQRQNALLETRAGRDRRKSKPSISVSI